MVYTRCEGLFLVAAHGRSSPSDDEWQAYLRDNERWMSELVGALIYTAGGGPNSAQRRALREMFARTGPVSVRTAVVSGDLLVRGITNAINLFNPHIRTFKPEALDAAIVHVRGALHGPALRAALAEQRARLG
jgi:hypothetical protein